MSEPSYFDCKAAYLRLNDFLDRELSQEEVVLVQAHLERCRVCAMEYAFEASLMEQIRLKVREGQAPPELKAAVQELLRQARIGES